MVRDHLLHSTTHGWIAYFVPNKSLSVQASHPDNGTHQATPTIHYMLGDNVQSCSSNNDKLCRYHGREKPCSVMEAVYLVGEIFWTGITWCAFFYLVYNWLWLLLSWAYSFQFLWYVHKDLVTLVHLRISEIENSHFWFLLRLFDRKAHLPVHVSHVGRDS